MDGPQQPTPVRMSPLESKRDLTIRYVVGTVLGVLLFQCIWKSFTQIETVS
jgi:hypothetical protein